MFVNVDPGNCQTSVINAYSICDISCASRYLGKATLPVDLGACTEFNLSTRA